MKNNIKNRKKKILMKLFYNKKTLNTIKKIKKSQKINKKFNTIKKTNQ